MNLQGQTALVTGASSGLGECFANQLAAMGANLVVCARRAERLEALARDIRAGHGVQVRCLPMDLSQPDSPAALLEKTEGANRPVDVLINNAGFASYSPFIEASRENLERQIRLNLFALTELTHVFANAMRARSRGHILNVASFAGYTPVPMYATYAAGKAFVRNLSEALAQELSGSGVQVCALCPGAVQTDFFQVAGQKEIPPLVRKTLMTPERVARIGLRALFRGRRIVVPGPGNKLSSFFMRILPRRFLVHMTARTLSKGRDGG